MLGVSCCSSYTPVFTIHAKTSNIFNWRQPSSRSPRKRVNDQVNHSSPNMRIFHGPLASKLKIRGSRLSFVITLPDREKRSPLLCNQTDDKSTPSPQINHIPPRRAQRAIIGSLPAGSDPTAENRSMTKVAPLLIIPRPQP